MIWSNHRGLSWLAWLPVAIVGGGILFTIRGYSITSDAILIHRLGWTTRLSLDGLQSAQPVPDAMHRSIRLFGNGGLFSFTGFFRNKALGNYRAFVTDPRQTIVLRFSKRIVVISPGSQKQFIQDLGVANPAVV